MKNKFFAILSFVLILLFSTVCDAQAFTSSKSDIELSIQKLDQLAKFDYTSLLHKNELIGYRLDNYNLDTNQYRRDVESARDNLINNLNKIDIINTSVDFSDTEKQIQLNQVYQNVDTTLSNINSRTLMYLTNTKRYMPTITAQQYISKFQKYYDSLNISNKR